MNDNFHPMWDDPINWKDVRLAIDLQRYCEDHPERYNLYQELCRAIRTIEGLEGTREELHLLAEGKITLPQFGPVKLQFLKAFIDQYHARKPSNYIAE